MQAAEPAPQISHVDGVSRTQVRGMPKSSGSHVIITSGRGGSIIRQTPRCSSALNHDGTSSEACIVGPSRRVSELQDWVWGRENAPTRVPDTHPRAGPLWLQAVDIQLARDTCRAINAAGVVA